MTGDTKPKAIEKGYWPFTRSFATEGVSGKPFPVPWGRHEVTGDTKPKAIGKGYWPFTRSFATEGVWGNHSPCLGAVTK